jgi:hypothetical protein
MQTVADDRRVIGASCERLIRVWRAKSLPERLLSLIDLRRRTQYDGRHE